MRFASLFTLLVGSVAMLAACESGYAVEGSVTASSDVTPAGPVQLEVIVEGFAAPVDGDWVPTNTHAGAILDTFGGNAAPYRYDQFGMAPHALYAGAFLDLDGNGELDPGEPFGVFADNPILDAPSGWYADPVVADIAIDSVFEPPAAN